MYSGQLTEAWHFLWRAFLPTTNGREETLQARRRSTANCNKISQGPRRPVANVSFVQDIAFRAESRVSDSMWKTDLVAPEVAQPCEVTSEHLDV